MKVIKNLTAVFLLSTLFLNASNAGSVYICNTSNSKKYHSSSGCRGLNRCNGEIIKVSVSKAKNMGRSSCSICY